MLSGGKKTHDFGEYSLKPWNSLDLMRARSLAMVKKSQFRIAIWRCMFVKRKSMVSNLDMHVCDLWNSIGEWDELIIRSLINTAQDLAEILKIYVPPHPTKDGKIQPFTRNGQLSTKSAYKTVYKKSKE